MDLYEKKNSQDCMVGEKILPLAYPQPPHQGYQAGFLAWVRRGRRKNANISTTEHVPGHVSYTLGRGRRGRRKNANISNTEHVPEYVYHTLARGRLREGGR